MAKKDDKEPWKERELQRRKDRAKDAKVFTDEERTAYLARCRQLHQMIDDAVVTPAKKKEDDWLESLLK